jgi:Zn finger protein HypA/HybF involved in hydrogenase expression
MSRTTKAMYECRSCLRYIRGSDVLWKLPNRAVMTMNVNVLREQMEGPFCPHCDSEVLEAFPTGDSDG